MNWLKNLFRPPTVRRPSVTLPRPGMVLERWQKDDGLVTWARTSAEFSDALAVVQSLQPTGFPVRGQVVSDMQCAVELGRKEGYADCQNVLLALRQFPLEAKEEIPADYDNTEYAESK